MIDKNEQRTLRRRKMYQGGQELGNGELYKETYLKGLAFIIRHRTFIEAIEVNSIPEPDRYVDTLVFKMRNGDILETNFANHDIAMRWLLARFDRLKILVNGEKI